MKKNCLLALATLLLITTSQNTIAKNPDKKPLAKKSALKNKKPIKSRDLPPVIMVRGKEKEPAQKVFIRKVQAGSKIEETLAIFDRNKNEKDIKVNSYGLPSTAKLNITKDKQLKNRTLAILTWETNKTNKGFHTIVIEAVNSKGAINRIALSYNIN